MEKRTCTIEDCESTKIAARGWCNAHWLRWSRYGDPLAGKSRRYDTAEERFAARTAPADNGCILWTGADCPQGYGKMNVDGRNEYAHRYAWTRVHGPIPDGMQVDHTCHNRLCCNVDHLRLASNKQNQEHRSGPQRNNRSSGIRGVTLHKPTGKWVVQVGHNGIHLYCGIFEDIHEAERIAIEVRNELFTHNDIDRAKARVKELKEAA